MTGQELLELSYLLVNKVQATFLDGTTATSYKLLNTAYGHRVLDILRARVDRNATVKEVTTDLISTVGLVEGDNGFNGEYAFPANLLKPIRFEISYDGVQWKKADIYDNGLNLGSEYNATQLETDFSQLQPKVDFARNSYKIRPPKNTAGDITKGIYIEYEARQVDFDWGTTPIEIEQSLQDLLAYDLAEMEILMHSAKYTAQEVQMFRLKKSEAETRFFEFYKSNLTPRKVMTFNLPRNS